MDQEMVQFFVGFALAGLSVNGHNASIKPEQVASRAFELAIATVALLKNKGFAVNRAPSEQAVASAIAQFEEVEPTGSEILEQEMARQTTPVQQPSRINHARAVVRREKPSHGQTKEVGETNIPQEVNQENS